VTVHTGVEAHSLGGGLFGDRSLEHFPELNSSMLLAKFLLVCALLSITYERQFSPRNAWCGVCTTFVGFGVSHPRRIFAA
jgi:hypothetical protein